MTYHSSFKGKALAIVFISTAISIGIVWFGFSMAMRITAIEEQWQEYDQNATTRASALSRMQSHLGYGGLIHNFKNYILRHDERLIPLIEEDFLEVYQAIKAYELVESAEAHEDPKQKEEELQKLGTIKQVVDLYAVKFDLVQRLVAEGHTTEYLDKQVKINDQPALQSIKFIAQEVLKHSQSQERQTDQKISKTISFMKWGAAIIPLVLLGGGAMIVFIRQIVRANREVQSARYYVDQVFDSAPDPILIVTKDGLISRANAAAEELLGYSRDELARLGVDVLIPEGLRQEHGHAQAAAFQRGKTLDIKKRGDLVTLNKAGQSIPVEINISFTELRGDTQAIVSMRDVSKRRIAELEIRKSQARYRAILDSAFQFIILLKSDGSVLDANNSSLSFAGLNKLAVIGRPYWKTPWWAHDPEQQKIVQQAVQRALTGEVVRFQAIQLSADGEQRNIDYSFSPVRDGEGKIAWIVPEGRDITELHQAEERLRLTEKVFDDTAEAIFVTDSQKRIVDMNQAFSLITGYSRDELLGQTPSLLSSGQHDQSFYKGLWSALNSQDHWQSEIWDKRKNGEIFPARVSISAVKDDAGETTHYVAVMSDITVVKENEAKLEQLAHYDQLTGLANRTLFYDRLREELARAKRHNKHLAIMYIDLDGFKAVNDSLGHQAGDAVLIEASGYLNQCRREYDVAARLGGDEFALLLTDLNDSDIVNSLAARVVNKLHIQINGIDELLHVTGSVGVAIFPEHGEDEVSLVRNADEAMYRAKQQGKHAYQLYS